jgi:MYXO-CTERM domain-containing protein
MKRVAAGLVVLLAGLASAQAEYLSYKMIATNQNKFRVYVDSRSSTPGGLNQTLMQNAVERAWNTWNAAQCAYPKVQSLGATGGTVPNADSTVDDFSVTPVWELTEDQDAREIFGNSMLVSAITLPRAYAGVLQTCDIFFNAFNFSWSIDQVTPPNFLDVETVMLHEGGHCLGLGHWPPYESVMYQVVELGESNRALTTIDTQYLCSRYPLAGESGSPCLGDGGCSQLDLKCISQPTTNNITMNLCTRGCSLGTNELCDVPLSCQASTAFSGFSGACLLPGNIITQVGKPCTMSGECGSSFGICQRPMPASNNQQFWIDGYCTQGCEPGQPVCPAGTTCGQLDVGQRCLQNCRVGLADCRPGYACAQIDAIGTTGVCIPRCYADQDCANSASFSCRTCDGLCVARQNISGQIGDVCSDATTCGAGQVCRTTVATSSTKQCTTQCGRGCGVCPTGTTCAPGAGGELFCLKNCTGPGTCPLGLRCAQTAVGQACIPACQTNLDCPVGEQCFNGECVPPNQGDGGCTALSCRPDAGRPIVVIPPDAGMGPSGEAGCGCTSADPGAVFALLGVLSFMARRRSWRRPQ